MSTPVPMRFPGDLLWTVPDVFEASECGEIIRWVEEQQPKLATNNPTYRDQDRVFKDDPPLAEELLKRIRQSLPDSIGDLRLAGINDRLRFYRYSAGQRFEAHMDHWYQPDDKTITLLSVLLYLNDDYEGGETVFVEQLDQTISPKRGQVAVFQHKVRHEGRPVTAGTKYVMRSDVIYKASSPIELTFEGA